MKQEASARNNQSKSADRQPLDSKVLDPKVSAIESTSRRIATNSSNAVLTQIGGRFNSFRQVLKKVDRSGSGSLNFDEFKSAVLRFGVHVPDSQLRFETLKTTLPNMNVFCS